MKKILALVLCGVLGLSIVAGLSGCKSEEEKLMDELNALADALK